MFRLPGYVGGEPEQPVSREVVAVMVAGEGQAAWVPDFWVDDVDESVAHSAELGAGAAAGAFDTPVGRTAVLTDPQGAQFSITTIAAVAAEREAKAQGERAA